MVASVSVGSAPVRGTRLGRHGRPSRQAARSTLERRAERATRLAAASAAVRASGWGAERGRATPSGAERTRTSPKGRDITRRRGINSHKKGCGPGILPDKRWPRVTERKKQPADRKWPTIGLRYRHLLTATRGALIRDTSSKGDSPTRGRLSQSDKF